MPDMKNMYSYVAVDPINNIDPLGLTIDSANTSCGRNPIGREIAMETLYAPAPNRNAIAAAARKFGELARKGCQNHHLLPLHLAGPKNGPTATLPAAYHQKLTNEFRKFGLGAKKGMTIKKLADHMKNVYKKFPADKFKGKFNPCKKVLELTGHERNSRFKNLGRRRREVFTAGYGD